MTNCQALFFVNPNAPIFLDTDASDYGIGGYLYQVVGDVQQPIAFVSKTLSDVELRWSVFDKEGYAIFYCMTKLEYLLRDVKFTLRTDHKNLIYINDHFTPKVKRWKLAIQHFDFEVIHIPGVENVVADGLSRLCSFPKKKAVFENLNNISAKDLDSSGYFWLSSDVYSRIDKIHNAENGHFGEELTIAKLMRTGHKWPGMRRDVQKFLFQCPFCQKMARLKIPIHTHPFTLASYAPMQRIAVDTIGPLPEDNKGNAYIVVIIDCFSRIVECYPATDTTAIQAANAVHSWMCRYGLPSQIVSDNGSQFANELVETFCNLNHIDHHLIHPYSHEENGIVE
jgi:hypothetical protein